jgi:DNA polymerase III epsilon subunit-like protein
MAESVMGPDLIFVDLETSGIDPKRHAIIQIAAIAIDNELQPVEAFEAKIRFDEHRANKNSLRKNHYQKGIWAREAQKEEEVGRTFAAFLRRHASVPMTSARGEEYLVAQLVAHNAAFDGPFLQAWYARLGIFLPASRHVLCTMQRAIWYFTENPALLPPKDFKLATLCHYFGATLHAADAHEALSDATATFQLYQALMRGRSSHAVAA